MAHSSKALAVLWMVSILFSCFFFVPTGRASGRVFLHFYHEDGSWDGIIRYGERLLIELESREFQPIKIEWWWTRLLNGTRIELTEDENLTSILTPPLCDPSERYYISVNATDAAGYTESTWDFFWITFLQARVEPLYSVVEVGGNVTFTVVWITDGVPPPYRIQWLRNGSEVFSFENRSDATFQFMEPGGEFIKAKITDCFSRDYITPQCYVRVITSADISATVRLVPAQPEYSTSSIDVGDIITFNATVENVTNLNLYQLSLWWDTSLLDIYNITLPSDNVFSEWKLLGNEVYQSSIVEEDSSYCGIVWCGAFAVPRFDTGEQFGFNGTGTLCQIEYIVRRKLLE